MGRSLRRRSGLDGDPLGLDPAAIEKMKAPVLVRVMDALAHDAPKEDLAAAVRRFNEGMTQALSPKARAVAEARSMTPGTVEAIGRLLAGEGDATLREVMRDRPEGLIEALRRDGIINAQNQSSWLAGGRLTEEAKDRVEGMFLGRVLGSGDRMAATSPAVLSKIERIAPELVRVEGVNPEMNEVPTVQAAIDVMNDAKRRGLTVEDLNAQTGLFGGDRVPADVAALAGLIETAKPKELQARFKAWAELAAHDPRQATMFAPNATREEARAALLEGKVSVPEREAWAREQASAELAANPELLRAAQRSRLEQPSRLVEMGPVELDPETSIPAHGIERSAEPLTREKVVEALKQRRDEEAARRGIKPGKGEQAWVIRNADTGWNVGIGTDGIAEMTASGEHEANLLSALNIEPLLERAVRSEAQERKPHEGEAEPDKNILAFHTFYAPAVMDGVLYRVKMQVKETQHGRGSHLHQYSVTALEVKESPAPGGGRGGVGEDTRQGASGPVEPGSPIKLSRLLAGAKREGGGEFLWRQRFEQGERPPLPVERRADQWGGGERAVYTRPDGIEIHVSLEMKRPAFLDDRAPGLGRGGKPLTPGSTSVRDLLRGLKRRNKEPFFPEDFPGDARHLEQGGRAREPLLQDGPVTGNLVLESKGRRDTGPRGYMEFQAVPAGEPVRIDVHLLRTADKSTLAHELFHAFSVVLGQVATREDASPEVRAQYQGLLALMGYGSHEERLSAPDRAKEEKASHLWEMYLSEGKAPTAALEGAFTRMKRWLVHSYGDWKGISKQYEQAYGQKLELSDDARALFDRLLGSDQAAEEAAVAHEQRLFTPLSAQEQVQDRELSAAGRAASSDEILRAAAADDATERRRIAREEGPRLRAEAEDALNQDPDMRAVGFLQTGEIRGHSREVLEAAGLIDSDGRPVKLSREDALAELGAAGVRALPAGILDRKGHGLKADDLAARLGYEDGRALLRQLAGKDFDRAAQDLVRQKLEERFGPALLDDPDRLRDVAAGAFSNEPELKRIFLRLGAIARELGPSLARRLARRPARAKARDARARRAARPRRCAPRPVLRRRASSSRRPSDASGPQAAPAPGRRGAPPCSVARTRGTARDRGRTSGAAQGSARGPSPTHRARAPASSRRAARGDRRARGTRRCAPASRRLA